MPANIADYVWHKRVLKMTMKVSMDRQIQGLPKPSRIRGDELWYSGFPTSIGKETFLLLFLSYMKLIIKYGWATASKPTCVQSQVKT